MSPSCMRGLGRWVDWWSECVCWMSQACCLLVAARRLWSPLFDRKSPLRCRNAAGVSGVTGVLPCVVAGKVTSYTLTSDADKPYETV